MDATLPSGTGITTPYSAFGFPDVNSAQMIQTYGDGKWGFVLTFAGFISLVVEDQFHNPISNIPVDFQMKPPVDMVACNNPNNDHRPGELVKGDDPCLKTIPTLGHARGNRPFKKSQATPEQRYMSYLRAPAANYTIRGGDSQNRYRQQITWYNLHLEQQPFGSCKVEADPSRLLLLESLYTSDNYGHNINAGKTGTHIPVIAKMTYICRKRP